jgi:hypothetical protein
MSSQVKKSGQCQLRDKKPPVLFDCFIANRLMGQFQVSDANCSCSANICNSLATEFTTQFQVQIARGGSAVANLLSIT